MLKFIKKYSYSFYLGASITAFCGVGLSDYQWWAIVIPTTVLVVISQTFEPKNNE